MEKTRIERISKKAIYGISLTTPVVVFLLLNRFYYHADVLPELSKWPRRAIFFFAAGLLSAIISSILIKVWPAKTLDKAWTENTPASPGPYHWGFSVIWVG